MRVYRDEWEYYWIGHWILRFRFGPQLSSFMLYFPGWDTSLLHHLTPLCESINGYQQIECWVGEGGRANPAMDRGDENDPSSFMLLKCFTILYISLCEAYWRSIFFCRSKTILIKSCYTLLLIGLCPAYSKTTRNFNAPMGKAAKFTIAEVCALHVSILNKNISLCLKMLTLQFW